MECLEALIDTTTFGTVRQYLRAAHSPITSVLLVRHRDSLPCIGNALIAPEQRSRSTRVRQWQQWASSGEVQAGGAIAWPGPKANLDEIPDSAACEVLFVPPVYLVCLGDFKMHFCPRDAQIWKSDLNFGH